MEVEERRRVRKVREKFYEQEVAIALPRRTFNITEKIIEILGKIKGLFEKQERLTFSELVNSDKREDKIMTFIPLLHLDNNQEVRLEQKKHFGEIDIYLHKKFDGKELVEGKKLLEVEGKE